MKPSAIALLILATAACDRPTSPNPKVTEATPPSASASAPPTISATASASASAAPSTTTGGTASFDADPLGAPPSMPELTFTSAVDLAAMIREKQVSPVEVAEAYLQRIEEQNPRLNAFVHVEPERVLREAHKAEDAVHRGKALGGVERLAAEIIPPEREVFRHA